MYKAVVFDLYGTLLDIKTDETQLMVWEKLAYFYRIHEANYTVEALQNAYLDEVVRRLEKVRHKGIEHPDVEILNVFKALFRAKGIKAKKGLTLEAARLFRILTLEYVKPYPGAFELLGFLKANGYRVLLLSNAQSAFTMDELKVTGILPYLDGIYLSSEYRCAKPEAAFFEVLLSHEGLTAEECLFVGNDHTTDIEGANRVGMKSVYLHTNCSQSILPDEIHSTHRVDSGDLFSVIQILSESVC